MAILSALRITLSHRVILSEAKDLGRGGRGLLLAFADLIFQTATFAQKPGTIAGAEIDASTGSALSGAVVTLTSADAPALLGESPATTGFALGRAVPTSSVGEYRFTDLPVGTYRLYVRRIGYVPTALDVRLGDVAASRLSIGLVVAPVRLRAVEVRAAEHNARVALRSDYADAARVAAAHARQRAFLATDARELTTADVAQSATLGGGDVLRTLQRLPGVTPLDEWSAKLLVRGNRWDHDRIYFDNLPLFDPLGALGRASGGSADAIGGAFLHPGVRPVSLGGEGATRIDLGSRSAASSDEWRGTTTLSQLGIAGSAERAREDGTAAIAVTAQHSAAAWFSNRRRLNGALGDPVISDAQASLRTDLQLGASSALELSAIVNDDARYWPPSSTAPVSPAQQWANVAGRMTYRALLRGVVASQTIGATHFGTRANDWAVEVPDGAPSKASSLVTRSAVEYMMLSGRVSATSATLPTIGYDVVTQRSSLSGPRQGLYWGTLSPERDARASELTYGSVWVDHRASVGERVAVEAGARADIGGARGVDAVRPGGALQLRYTHSPRTLVSAGVGRTNQYVQSIDLPIVARGQTTPSLWLTAGGDVPALRVDNATVGVERWVGAASLLSAYVSSRRTTGAIDGDPTVGPLPQRPLFVSADELAHGVELSARKLAGRVTGFASYAFNATTTHADGLAYASNATRPHSFAIAVTTHAGKTRLATAFKAASGAPFTRIVAEDNCLL